MFTSQRIKFAIYNTKIGFHPQKEYNSEKKESYMFTSQKMKFAIYNTKIGFHPQKEYNSEQKENYIFKNAKNMLIFIE